MKKSEIDFKKIEPIEFDNNNNPIKIFGKHLSDFINNLEEIQKEDKDTIKGYIAGSIGKDKRTIENWCSPSNKRDINVSSIVKFAKLSDMSLDELLTDTDVNIDETFAKRTGLTDKSTKAIVELNRNILWSSEFKHTMEKLHFNETTYYAMASYGKQTKKQEFALWESKELITVTFSQFLNYIVQKYSYNMEILKEVSNILNQLKDWKDREDRTELIERLRTYNIEDENAYIDFKDSINDDEKLKKDLDATEKSLSEIMTKLVKEFILDEFRQLPSEKSEKTSNL